MRTRFAVAVLVAAAAWGACLPAALAGDGPQIRSANALIMDADTGEVLYDKNADAIVPIASITKLMTALVVLEAGLPLDAEVEIGREDVAATRRMRSPLFRGATLTRDDLLRLALMASENRAAAALARTYPGGTAAFVQAMNEKAAELGMRDSRFVEPTGLSSGNVSSAADLARLVLAANAYPLIREYSTAPSARVRVGRRSMTFVNTNALVRNPNWEIGISKTGFIREAGRCLVMQANLSARSVVIVLLDSVGKYTRIGDANRIRQWLDTVYGSPGGTRIEASVGPTARRRAGDDSPIRLQREAPALR